MSNRWKAEVYHTDSDVRDTFHVKELQELHDQVAKMARYWTSIDRIVLTPSPSTESIAPGPV